MKTKLSFLALMVILFIAASALAVPFELIPYTKKTSLAYPRNYTLRFSLCDDPVAGTCAYWSEEKTVYMSSSKIKTYLGDTVALSGVDFSQQYFVQVEKKKANGSYKVIGARDMLGVVPYALWSASSDSVLPGGSITSITAGTGITATPNPITATGTISANIGTSSNQVAAGNHAHSFGQITGTLGHAQLSGAYTESVSFVDVFSLSATNITGTNVKVTGNLSLPATTATTGVIKSGADTLMHTYGTHNFFAGVNAGNLTMTGQYNTATGSYALYNNTEGNYNTATGGTALYHNTTGDYNTATGARALYYNTTGDDNTAMGTDALFNNTTGDSNTATGAGALRSNTTGWLNTAMGTDALFNNTTGLSNTAIGMAALYSNETGDQNTATGFEALKENTIGNSNTAIGRSALYYNTTGENNTATGESALLHNTTGVGNAASGYAALNSNTTGNNNTAVGYNADVAADNLTNATAIGYDAVVDASNHVRIGNTAVTQIGGQVAWSNLSDMREKKDIFGIPFGLDFIRALRPVEFRLINGNDRIDFGFIAQDIERLIGIDYNILGIGGTEERKLSLRYTDFIAPMVKAMQEQQEIIDRQQSVIEKQQAEIISIKARLASIEAILEERL